MLQILKNDTSLHVEPEPRVLASNVCKLMKCTKGWCREGADGVLTVIRDQSRYFSITNPDLRRNFVAKKTRDQIATTAVLEAHKIALPIGVYRV